MILLPSTNYSNVNIAIKGDASIYMYAIIMSNLTSLYRHHINQMDLHYDNIS